MKQIGYIDGRRISGFRLEGASALNGVALTIADTTTPSSGYSRGLYLNYTSSGAKTGGTTEVLAIDMTISGNVSLAYAADIYMGFSGTPTSDVLVGLYMYLDDPTSGAAGAAYYAQRIQIFGGRAAVTGWWSLRRLGVGQADFIMQFESTAMATYFIKQDNMGSPFAGGSYAGLHANLRCYVGGQACYIHVYV